MQKYQKGNNKEFGNISVDKQIKDIAKLFYKEKNRCTKPQLFQKMFQVLEFSECEKEFLYLLKSFKKILLKKKITLCQLKFQGKNVLMIAIEKNFLKAIKRLLKEKLNFESIDNNGETAVFYLTSFKRQQNQETEKFILKQGVNLTHKNNRNQTVLDKALKNKSESLIIQILKSDFNLVYQVNNQGVSPLSFIFEIQNQQILQILKQKLKKETYQTMIESCKQFNKVDRVNEKQSINKTKKNSKLDIKKQSFQKQNQNKKKISVQLEKNKMSLQQQEQIRRKSHKNFKISQEKETTLTNKKIIENYHNEISELKKRINFFKKQNEKLKEKKRLKNLNKQKKALCQQKDKIKTKSISVQQQSIQVTENLQDQIVSYQKYIYQYQVASEDNLNIALKTVKKSLMNFFGQNIDIKLAGSISNNLNMPWSDINLHILPKQKNLKYKKKDKYQKDIYEFKKLLCQEHYIKNCKLSRNMSLSILNFTIQQDQTQHQVELIFKFMNNSFPENDEIIQQFLEHYLIAKPLYLTFRKMLHKHKLDNPQFGGLNNLCILTLIVAFLQQCGIQKNSNYDILEKQLGQLFQNFLYFYCFQFDYINFGIQLQRPDDSVQSPFFMKHVRGKLQQLVINHPYKKNIIITKSFKRIEELKQVFTYSYYALFQNCRCSTLKKQKIIQYQNEQIVNNKQQKNNHSDDITTICETPLDKFQSIVVNYCNKFTQDIQRVKETQKFQKIEIQSQISHSTKLDSLFVKKASKKNLIEEETHPNFGLVKIFNLNLQNIIL